MHSATIAAVTLLAATSSALVLPRQQSPQVIAAAGGAPPNGALPSKISNNAVADFQGVNFLENLESAFFEAGLTNLTAWNHDGKLDRAIEIVTKVQAQELIHVQTAENILKHNGNKTFTPCKYQFPVNNAAEFFALSNIITSVGIGAVIDVASNLALTDPELVPGPASILAIEARHDAFFRAKSVSHIPNPAPFDTRISATYALNLASPFIVPNSCTGGMPSFTSIPALNAVQQKTLTGSSGPIDFTFDAGAPNKDDLAKTLYIGWVNQANVVNYTPATLNGDGKVSTEIPAGLAGLAFAALTSQNEAVDVNSLTSFTLAGLAPVQIS
ncbi:hypothetical protein P7C71_g2207, partial [Lecanoromycetidae sp. Uapishka_2]